MSIPARFAAEISASRSALATANQTSSSGVPGNSFSVPKANGTQAFRCFTTCPV